MDILQVVSAWDKVIGREAVHSPVEQVDLRTENPSDRILQQGSRHQYRRADDRSMDAGNVHWIRFSL